MEILRKLWDVEDNRNIVLVVMVLFGFFLYFENHPRARVDLLLYVKSEGEPNNWLVGATIKLYDKDKNFLAKGYVPRKTYGYDRTKDIRFPHPKLGDCMAMLTEENLRRFRKEKPSSPFLEISLKDLTFKRASCEGANYHWKGSWINKVALIKVEHPECETGVIPFRGEGRWAPWRGSEPFSKTGPVKGDHITHVIYYPEEGGGADHSLRHILTPDLCEGS